MKKELAKKIKELEAPKEEKDGDVKEENSNENKSQQKKSFWSRVFGN